MKLKTSALILALIVFAIASNVSAQTNRTPKQIFNGLKLAYKTNNRKQASKYATPKVVRQLFGTHSGLDISPWDYNSCQKDKRGYHCFLEYTAGGLNLWIRKVGGKYYVTRLLAIAD
jgi:hypothetical protein